MYAESDLLPLSGLQHLAFCPRQWALIHIEQSWADNRLTAEGHLVHRQVDEVDVETRNGVHLVRALPIRSLRLGLSGRADLVEFPFLDSSQPPVPVEFKRGRPKHDDIDEVQLCAQGICLEEMLSTDIPAGAIFYHRTRRRIAVPFTGPLRLRVLSLAGQMHELHARGITPEAKKMPKCRSCSLVELCQPAWLEAMTDPWTHWQRLLRETALPPSRKIDAVRPSGSRPGSDE